MNTSTASDTLVPSPADNMEQPGAKVMKKLWVDTKSLNVPNVLDPDDSLMKKFQSALREHLIRVDNKLNSEILELVSVNSYFSRLKGSVSNV